MNSLQKCLEIVEVARNRTGRGSRPSANWDTVIRLWFECENQHEISRRLNIRQGQVSRILRSVGIRVGRGKRKPVHPLPMSEVAKMYRAGHSTTDLGRLHSVDAEVIRRRLLNFGQPMRRRGEYERSGSSNPQWKGGRQQVREYHKLARRIAAFCLGSTLPTGIVVHHHDEDETNNHPSNLWLFPSGPNHNRYHQQLLKNRVEVGSKEASRLASKNGGRALPIPDDLTPLSLGTSLQFPYDTRVRVENALRELGILHCRKVRLRERRQ